MWVFTGSTSFALQGMNIKIDDIDVQIDESGAYQMQGLFTEYIVKKVCFSSTDVIRSHFGELNINGIKVEIMGDIQKKISGDIWEEPVDLIQHRRFVEFQGMKLPILSLEYEVQAYEKLHRFKKTKRLSKFLNKKE